MKPKNTKEESLKVPADILLDILGIIVKENMKHEIIQVQPSRSIVVIELFLGNGSLRQQQAFERMQSILEEYNEYRWSDNDELNWKD